MARVLLKIKFNLFLKIAARMGEAYITAHEGDDLKNRNNTATCLKHYIGYSFPINGRDRTPAYIPENLLREVFLPPFAAGVLAGSPTVMINSGLTRLIIIFF